ncbi:MAG: regulatory protein RecX, partial [Lachnospiraceae bacterium]|nr:regulatory protein RecX [Lachnospiraceae bacterium]
IVTSIVPKGKTRCRITTDGGDFFVLSVRDVRLYGIEEGTEISDSVWSVIREQLRKEILQESAALLGSQDYTERRLSEKLLRKGYPEELVRDAVKSLKEARYLDDRRLAEHYFQAHMQDRSAARIRQDLLSRGVDADLIEEVISTCPEEELQEEQLQQIRQLLEKKHFDPETADYAGIQKMAAFLYRRGFDPELIRRAMRT